MRNEGILGTNMEKYLQNMNDIKDAESVLLWNISDEEKNGELVEQVKAKTRHRVKYVAVAISIAVILTLFFSGCKAGA